MSSSADPGESAHSTARASQPVRTNDRLREGKGQRAPRVLLIVGTRPEAIKMAPVYRALALRDVGAIVTSTGQHRDMLDPLLAALQVRVDHDLKVMEPRQALTDLGARIMNRLGSILRNESPDLVIVQGDTTSALMGAVAAYYEGIPVAHVEAGLRSGSLEDPFPEEGNRRLIGQIALWHFAPTRAAALNLIGEGVAAERIQVTGNTVIDNLLWARNQSLGSSPFQTQKRRILVTVHRRENHGPTLIGIASALTRIAARGDVEIVFPVHRNPAVRDVILPKLGAIPGIRLVDPLDYLDFVATLDECDLVLTDSGGVQEEAPSLGKPVLVLRRTTERPEGVDAGTARLVGVDPHDIYQQTVTLLDYVSAYQAMAQVANPYGDGLAAPRIVERLQKDWPISASAQ